MINRIKLILVLCCFSLVACQDKSLPNLGPYELDAPFELGIGESSSCVCGTPDVTFVKVVSDSRCPTELECFWAGEVSIEMEVGSETIQLSNSVEAFANLDTDTIGNFSYQLLEVRPYPSGTTEIPAGDYEVDIIVRQL